MTYQGWFAPPDQLISSLTSADYTTFSATYGESGSFSGPGTMTESVVSSSSFTLSLTNVDSTTGLLSTAYQTVQGGQGSQPYTLYQTTNDNYTDTVTSSFVATQSNSAGVINETVVGGTSGTYNISDLIDLHQRASVCRRYP